MSFLLLFRPNTSPPATARSLTARSVAFKLANPRTSTDPPAAVRFPWLIAYAARRPGPPSRPRQGDYTPSVAVASFPTQYAGLRIRTTATTVDLCVVATADAPTGMGGQVRVNHNGTVRALYLVETTDPNASPARVQTTTGTKAVRKKT